MLSIFDLRFMCICAILARLHLLLDSMGVLNLSAFACRKVLIGLIPFWYISVYFNSDSCVPFHKQERAAKASKGNTGKLSSQLEAQKKQTRNDLLNATSEQERRHRDTDSAAEARNYN